MASPGRAPGTGGFPTHFRKRRGNGWGTVGLRGEGRGRAGDCGRNPASHCCQKSGYLRLRHRVKRGRVRGHPPGRRRGHEGNGSHRFEAGGSVRIGAGIGCGSLGTVERNGVEPGPGKRAGRAGSFRNEFRQWNATNCDSTKHDSARHARGGAGSGITRRRRCAVACEAG